MSASEKIAHVRQIRKPRKGRRIISGNLEPNHSMPRFAYLWWLHMLSSMAEPFRRTFRGAFMAAGLPSFHPLSVLKRPAQSARIHRRERAIAVA